MRGLFVTGTDTGVGKTVVASGILRLALRLGRKIVPFKPAETGCSSQPTDALALWEAAGRPVPREAVCLYSFAPPVAPATAAAAAGRVISIDAIVDRARCLHGTADGVLVEGAGGILAPYAPDVTAADIAEKLGLPLLLVARAALGTINHTALTVNEIRRRRLPLAGIVLCQTTPHRGSDFPTNAQDIENAIGLAPLGTIAHLDPATPDSAADALANLGPHLGSIPCLSG